MMQTLMNDTRRSTMCFCVCFLPLLASPLSAQEDQNTEAGRAELSAELTLELQESDGQDGDQLQRDTGIVSTDLTLGLRQPLGDSARFQARLELSALYLSQSQLREAPEYNETSYDLERLFVQQFLAERLVRWRFGRQKIDDLFSSLVDETLDGLRITVENEALQLDFSYTRENWIEASTEERDDETFNALTQLTYRPDENSAWMPFALFRDQQALNPGDETAETFWLGLQGIIEPSESWRFWFDATARNGESIDENERTDLGGFALNLGASWKHNGRFKPVYSVALAHASDDYRQSGLHSNDFRPNKKNEFRYLGEVLDPELANLQILTLAAGAQIAKQWRVDIAAHSYEQVELEDNIRGSDLEYEPEGLNTGIGTALDLVVSYRPTSQLNMLGTAGVFDPGSAFSDDRSEAWLASLEIEYEF